jgi:hypothetical protein
MSDAQPRSDRSTDSNSNGESHPFTSRDAIDEYDWSRFNLHGAERTTTHPHRNPKILAYCYWVRGDSQIDIARRYGVTQPAVSYQMKQLGIPRIKHPSNSEAAVGYYRDGGSRGEYPRVCNWYDGDVFRTSVHRLTACVEHDPHDVFGDNDLVVHHGTGHPLDNRSDILEVVTEREHQLLHHADRAGWVVEDGEPRRRLDPHGDAPDPTEEWWDEVDTSGD